MCGRYVRANTGETYASLFGLPSVPEVRPSWNIAPTQPVLVARIVEGEVHGDLLRWGLIPFWAKDKKTSWINARSETVLEKPAFKAAAKRRRCLIFADGYYEWKTLGPKTKQAYYYRMADDKPFAFAGIWDQWSGDGPTLETCAILTTSANELAASVHDRMPVILRDAEAQAWIDPKIEDLDKVAELMKPFPTTVMMTYPVSSRVNSVKNNGIECVQPVE